MSFKLDINQILSYREMCNIERQDQLQRGMNFNIGGSYSVILMSIKKNSPYEDRISEDGLTIYYEGHDIRGDKLKQHDQSASHPSGVDTQNGLFVKAIEEAKKSSSYPLAKVYEKLYKGIWNYRGLFYISDYTYLNRGGRNVFEFVLTVADQNNTQQTVDNEPKYVDTELTRQIPGKVKLAVYERDGGACVLCGSRENLHFDHILPYSKGGTSQNEKNIQILCALHNLQKSAKINY